MHNQMASTLSQIYKNLPANCTETSALKELLGDDLELRSSILRRQEKVQARYTYAKKASKVFAACLATTSAVKDAYAACILSTKALEDSLKNALNLYDNHHDILATISSTKGMLVTWAETVALTEALLTHLDKSAPQVEAHLHLAADEHAAHESAHIAASDSMPPCTDMLRAVDGSIAKTKGALFGLRNVPTEILPRIFIEVVDARQREIIASLSSYYDRGSSYHDLNVLFKTINLAPFTLAATCKRWRAICQSTPRLWRYARVPMVNGTGQGNKIIGKLQFERCVLLAQKQPLDLTVYPCDDVAHRCAAYTNLVLPAESQILRVYIFFPQNSAIPSVVPSPTELNMESPVRWIAPYIQVLPTRLLANTKTLRCTNVIPQINSAVRIQTLHLSCGSAFIPSPPETFWNLLQNCPQLEELHLENQAFRQMTSHDTPFTHEQLHTLSLTGIDLPWVIKAFTAGCRFPRLSRLVLTDIHRFNLTTYSGNLRSINDQLSLLTHIEVHAACEPSVVAHLRPLFEASTALRTLTLIGSAMQPMLTMLTPSVPKRVQELRLSHSNANGTTLRDYLAAVERDGGGTSGMQVVWNNCPNFSGEYGGAFGELHL
jgi:hypothetical protein